MFLTYEDDNNIRIGLAEIKYIIPDDDVLKLEISQ